MVETIASLFLGLGLAASVGFRVFLPLLVLSVATHYGVVPVNETWSWVGSSTAMIVFLAATVLEILAFYIPWIDNLLDTVAVPTAAIAGTAVMASTAVDVDPLWKWALAIIAGGGTASVIKGSNATARVASTSTTGGLGNPAISTAETVASAGLSVISIYLWPLAAIIVIFLLIAIFFIFTKFKKKLSGRKHSR